MKKISLILCLILILSIFAGCGKEKDAPADIVQISNPWSSFDTLSDAEKEVGFSLGIPEIIGNYTASVFRVMSGELLEVRYTYGENEVTVRKQAGEGQDISGDYTEYPDVTDKDGVTSRTDGTVTSTIISFGGYSWSVHSPTNVSEDFTNTIIG